MDIGRTIERCTMADAGVVAELKEGAGDAEREAIEDLAAYFTIFAKPEAGEHKNLGCKCLKCGEYIGGLLGTFTWGLCHGEGFCGACKWPARAHHFIKDRHGADLATIRGVVLQYHPDEVEERKAS